MRQAVAAGVLTVHVIVVQQQSAADGRIQKLAAVLDTIGVLHQAVVSVMYNMHQSVPVSGSMAKAPAAVCNEWLLQLGTGHCMLKTGVVCWVISPYAARAADLALSSGSAYVGGWLCKVPGDCGW